MKIETIKHLSTFISFIENQFSMSLKCIRNHYGPKFLMHDLLNPKEIVHQRSCVEFPQQNGFFKGNFNTF